MDQRSDLLRWTERYAESTFTDRAPSAWVLEAFERIPRGSSVIDIAAGAGRHAIALARQGRSVVAVDFAEIAVRMSTRAHASIAGVVANVSSLPFRPAEFGAVVCTNFLERGFFDELKSLVKPGGYVVYETYTADHARLVEERGLKGPRSPAYLLQPGELIRLLSPFEILDAREGFVHDAAGDRYCASVLARRPALALTA